jgi:predicted nucleic acid-binding protein
MRAALDTNVLVYAEGVGDSKRVSASRELPGLTESQITPFLRR